jgi:polysaccharide chain length determinant protein (PEP-CTERM system associated)
MDSLRILLLQHARAMWRRKWYAIAVAWAVCVLGWIWVSRMPDLYESQARLYMNADAALTPLLRGIAVDNDPGARLDLMQRTLLSVPNMNKLIRMTDLDLQVKDAEDRERMVRVLQSQLFIRPQTPTLFTVGYRAPDPQLAQNVVSSLLSIFVESNIGDTRNDIESAQRFLQTQIDAYENQLREAERRRAEFRARYFDLLPMGDGGGTKLEESRAAVAHVTEDLNDAIARRDELQKSIATVPAMGATTAAGPEPFSPQARLGQLKIQLADLKMRFTDQHPEVLATQREIAALEDEVKKHPSESGGSVANPVYQQLQLRLADTETQIASLRRRLASGEQERDQLEEEARRAPGVVAEYQNLDRDYNVIQRNFEELLSRRESAHIAEEADKKGDKVQFKVVDPAEVPNLPVAPNRPLLLSGVLVAGLGAGLAVVFLLSQVDRSFSNTTTLQSLGLPVLGSISVVQAFDRRPRHWFTGAKGFAAACIALVIVYGGLLVSLAGHTHKLT